MKRIILIATFATAITGFAGSAIAGQMLLWGTDANDRKQVQVIDRPDGAFTKLDSTFETKSTYAFNGGRSAGGRTMLLWGTDENDNKKVEVINRPDGAYTN